MSHSLCPSTGDFRPRSRRQWLSDLSLGRGSLAVTELALIVERGIPIRQELAEFIVEGRHSECVRRVRRLFD